MDNCFGYLCFALNPGSQKFFGFSEYLASLALMVVAWTLAGIRYKFRISTATIPLLMLSYFTLGFIGISALLTDLWRAEGWRVFSGTLISPYGWQAVMGAIFLFVFLFWAWFALIFPSKYGRWNSFSYWDELHKIILKGNADECREIGEELGRSIREIVSYAWSEEDYRKAYDGGNRQRSTFVNAYYAVRFMADRILNLMADTRFCGYLVNTSSTVIFDLFSEIARTKKYNFRIGILAKNLTHAALNEKKSFVFYESGMYHNGYIGGKRSITTVLYGNYMMVEALECVFDSYVKHGQDRDPEDWEAYYRLVLMTMRNYVDTGALVVPSKTLSRVLYELRFLSNININLDEYRGKWSLSNDFRNFVEICEFLKKSIVILNLNSSSEKPEMCKIPSDAAKINIYDDVARAIYEIIVDASSIKNTREFCWAVHFRIICRGFFTLDNDGEAKKVIMYKVRRLIYSKITDYGGLLDFESANLVSFMINLFGLSVNGQVDNNTRFNRLILSWLAKNYVRCYGRSPVVAESCLRDWIKYDSNGKRLIRDGSFVMGRVSDPQILMLD